MSTYHLLAKRFRFGLSITLLPTLVVSVLLTSACVVRETRVELPPSIDPLARDHVQLTLRSGITTKNEVLESFGAPNVTTRDAEGQEVWTYQRYGRVIQVVARIVLRHRLAVRCAEQARRRGIVQSQHDADHHL